MTALSFLRKTVKKELSLKRSDNCIQAKNYVFFLLYFIVFSRDRGGKQQI